MLNPSVVELVAGVADALESTVVAELEAGPARDQVVGAVAILRRVARTLPTLGPALAADVVALTAALDRLGVLGDRTDPPSALAGAVALADRLAGSPPPPLDELVAAGLALRAELAAVAGRAGLDEDTDAVLRAELDALAARDAALRLSPWER